MNKLYSFATLLLSLTFINGAEAQTYTAVRSGYWHVNSGPNVWDASGEPPAVCNNCVITIQTGYTVTLNTDITLSGSSVLAIGDNVGDATSLIIPFSTSTAPATPFPNPSPYHRINLVYAEPVAVKLVNSNSVLDASTTGAYDGIFLAVPTPQANNPYSFIQRVGTSAQYGNATTVTGVQTLSSNGTLPIILSGFEARLNEDKVDLSWTTLIEVNGHHFLIERSTDGGAKWNSIGTVAARSNSSGTVSYTFTDVSPAAGVAQYRLVMVDLDGKTAYSPIKTVKTGLITGVSIYPNPARDFVNVSVSGSETSSLSIRLLNQSGQLLVEKKVTSAGGTTVSLPVSAYPVGNYLIVVKGTDGSQQVSKLFISK